ncbi:MAG TPA: CPBP family intramembrane glutamic endopeptidase, partial [Acidobacteriaceae bacterium]|nr:CPBP family intramembrane glutamic endopeptidase [Acidobacteriaceae bacterium]
LSTSEVSTPDALDIQHDTDPARDHGPARRIPHMGHALLFFLLAWLTLSVCALLILGAAHVRTQEAMKAHQGLGLAAQALSYVLTLALSWVLFPRMWERPFLRGIQWNVLAAKRRWYWMMLGGMALSGLAQMSLHFVSAPKHSSLDDLLRSTTGAWLMTAFGVLLAPVTEEIAFRGFLLPALATAYDWLALERTPAGLQKWQSSSMHSSPALIFAAIFSSVPFALLHAGQLEHARGALGILYTVSLVLSLVRIRTHSVACSTLMHATYNLTVFTVLFVSTGGYRHLEKFAH